MKAPQAKRIDHETRVHGQRMNDPYAWMRAKNWQQCLDDPTQLPNDIKHYLRAENAWFDYKMADSLELQKTLIAEMRGRIQDVDESLPDVKGPWCYQERYREAEEHPSYWRCLQGTSEQQLLIDFNDIAKAHEYFDPGDVEYSPLHTHLAWTADTRGSERYQLFIRNIATGEDGEAINDIESVTWGNQQYLFYTRVNEDFRANRVYRHRLGTSPSEDTLIYEETDTRFFCSVWTSLSADYVFISSDTNDESEVWFIPVDDITAKPVLIEPRREGVEYSVDHQDKKFLILTNADDAQDFKIMQAPCNKPSREHWSDWLEYREGVMVLDVYAYRNWVMWLERENALPRICYRSNESGDTRSLAFDQPAYAISLEPLQEYDECSFRFTFESPSTPCQTFSYDMKTGKQSMLKQEQIPSGHNGEHYIVKRLFAPAEGNVTIPVTILHHKHTVLDGTAPCLLSAYGAYGASMPADFSSAVLSLVDRGFVSVVAHVRGGQEKGRAWYEAAMLGNKTNTFDDVLTVGEFLVSERITGRGRLVLSGSSAGGLMVGAVLNRHSDLWAGAIADVPFVDVLNTLLDDSLPLTPGEWAQWGNPAEDIETFSMLKQYSPYDNIADDFYPPMLVTAGVSDPRVTYWEPAKWVAKLRAIRTDDTLLLLKTNMQSGHFGDTGRYAALADVAIEYAFALRVTAQATPSHL